MQENVQELPLFEVALVAGGGGDRVGIISTVN
jgi:hypothetical protein